MNHRRKFLLGSALGALLSGCGEIVLEPNLSSSYPIRRMYVNDSASNPDLNRKIKQQVAFALHPGAAYELRLGTPARVGDKLFLVDFETDRLWRTVRGVLQGGQQVFPFFADLPRDGLYLARVGDALGKAFAETPTHVRFVGTGAHPSQGFAVALYFTGPLSGIPDEPARAQVATAFHRELSRIFDLYSIAVDSTLRYQNLPIEDPVILQFPKEQALPFPGSFFSEPHIPVFLVESIVNQYAEEGSSITGEIVGFAPREAIGLGRFEDSRVVLSNPGALLNHLGSVRMLAITAAHEIGHFLGLGHTTASALDRLGVGSADTTAWDDGFADTEPCVLRDSSPMALGKQPYCLRIQAESCPSGCAEVDNLMYPDQCSLLQTRLSPLQREALSHNMRFFPFR